MPLRAIPEDSSKKDEKSELTTLRWPGGSGSEPQVSSFRGPLGLKERIDVFLKELDLETGVSFSRNDFILNAVRFYLRHLLQAKDQGDLITRMKEEFKFIDAGSEETKIET